MITALIFAFFIFVALLMTVKIVPQQSACIIERVGRYHRTLDAGLHIVIPFIDRVAYTHSLKEIVLDIPAQICITNDNVQVSVDGVIFFRVMDAHKASYGVNMFIQAIIQLSQTTLRSEIGKIELDRTFEEREKINNAVIMAIDAATDPWGVKVLRYEIKSIQPPKEILDAMEKQMRAEREKRAKILESEGDRDSKVNRADGEKQEVIKHSEAEKQKQINEAEGQAAAITSIAKATADGIKMVGEALSQKGGDEAGKLRVAEEYMKQFGQMAKNAEMIVVPSSVNDAAGLVATAFGVYDKLKSSREKTL